MLLDQAAVRYGFARGDGRWVSFRKCPKIAKGELAPTSAGRPKAQKPRRDVENQTKQEELIANHKKQVKEAIEQEDCTEAGVFCHSTGTSTSRSIRR